MHLHATLTALIRRLLAALPEAVRNALVALQSQAGRSTQNLMELNVQIGRQPEAVYTDDFGNKAGPEHSSLALWGWAGVGLWSGLAWV
eukprot:355299-Chlamydomonas_euryale.AAC.3